LFLSHLVMEILSFDGYPDGVGRPQDPKGIKTG
jgi:hypothetical protein